MAIIAILSGLILAAGIGVMAKAARSRAASEIAAMGTALENYKTDNGIYPQSDGVLLTNTYSATDPSQSGAGWTNGQVLYLALSGQTNFSDGPGTGAGHNKSYMTFKANQVGNVASGSPSYVKDPWGNAYLYSTGDNKSPEVITPYNGAGFFDLFSTGGVTATKLAANSTLTNAWISNWQN